MRGSSAEATSVSSSVRPSAASAAGSPIVQSGNSLLAREDADVADEVAKIRARRWYWKFYLSAKAERVASNGGRIRPRGDHMSGQYARV